MIKLGIVDYDTIAQEYSQLRCLDIVDEIQLPIELIKSIDRFLR